MDCGLRKSEPSAVPVLLWERDGERMTCHRIANGFVCMPHHLFKFRFRGSWIYAFFDGWGPLFEDEHGEPVQPEPREWRELLNRFQVCYDNRKRLGLI